MKRIILSAAILATLGTANAAVTLVGGSATTFSGFNPLPSLIGSQTYGLINAQLVANAANDQIHVTYLGKEAGYINEFLVNGSVVFNTQTSVAPTTQGAFVTPAGALNFAFTDVTKSQTVLNGDAPKEFINYVVLGSKAADGSFVAFTDNGKYDYVLGFNDSYQGAADYDDLVVGFTVSAVPEPETYALMLAGLGFMGFLARRRRAA